MLINESSAQLTAQFYEWEALGRGWMLAEEPIQLEPPFTPFFGHFRSKQEIIDDGLRHTVLSKLASVFNQKRKGAEFESPKEISYTPYLFEDDSPVVYYQIHISKSQSYSLGCTEQFLSMLSFCELPVSFEITATSEKIFLYITCREKEAHYIKSQLISSYKGVSVLEVVDIDFLRDDLSLSVVDYGLKEEFMRPIGSSKSTHGDSFAGLFSVLNNLRKDEQIFIQVLFNGILNNWVPSIIRSVSTKKGDAFFSDSPEMLPCAKDKIATPLFAATIRIITQADTVSDSQTLLQQANFAYSKAAASPWNSLQPLSDTAYSLQMRLEDIILRQSRRLGMLLNLKELSHFVHIPDVSILSKKAYTLNRKTKKAPLELLGFPLALGTNEHMGEIQEVSIPNELRIKHTHIIGATGTGKSTLLLNMIFQDISTGEGITVLDPHGDLIEHILKHIPEKRMGDVIVCDPSDTDFPIGLNILKAHSDIEKEVLSSDLVSAFRKLSSSWGDQMNSVLGNAILAFLESDKGGTLLELRRFLIERSYREAFLNSVSDPNILYYWQKEYPLLKTNSIGPILTRLDTFLRPRLIRNMVAQKKSLDFDGILNGRKILLVKLSQGLIGSENSNLLGTFIVSKIHQAAMARQSNQDRKNFFVYIDEFQHFITPSMGHILTGARKYHVGLILAHQDIQQVQKHDSELFNSLMANAGTRICFRVGDADAKRLSEGFSYFEVSDLLNLGIGEAIARTEKAENDFSLSTEIFNDKGKEYVPVELVLNASRNKYGTARVEVEDQLREVLGVDDGPIEFKKESFVSKEIQKEEYKRTETSSTSMPSISIETAAVQDVAKKKQESQHRYLQNLIKKIAESKGYKASLEVPTPDGKGKVDVLAEKGKETIAIEVSVTTTLEWEMHNIDKCIGSGYKKVLLCVLEGKIKDKAQEVLRQKFTAKELKRITVLEPDEILSEFEDGSVLPHATETIEKGYRVKVEYSDMTRDEMAKKKQSIAKLVSDAMKRMKK